MYGFPLDHLQRLVIILYCYMYLIAYVWNFSRPKQIEGHSLSFGISGLNISKCFTGKLWACFIENVDFSFCLLIIMKLNYVPDLYKQN